MGMDAHLAPSDVASRPRSFPWGAAGIAAACSVALGWWALSTHGPTLTPMAWKPIAVGVGVLGLLAAVGAVSWRAAVTMLKIALPICCVGFVAWKALGPGGMLSQGPRRLLAAAPGAMPPGMAGAHPEVLLEFLSQAGVPATEAAASSDLPPSVAEAGAPVTFVLEGTAGIDVGGTVRRALKEQAPGARPSWSMTTRVSNATVTVWMAGDFERVAGLLPVGREKSRDEAMRRVVIEVDPSRCVRRR